MSLLKNDVSKILLKENQNYKINIKQAVTYNPNSPDNKHYDIIIKACPENDFDNNRFMTYEAFIDIFENGSQVSMFFLATYCTILKENSIILNNDSFILLLDNIIAVVNLPDMNYHFQEIQMPFGTYYDIYKCEKGYIIHGELEVIMLDYNFSILWRYCTQDVLTNQKNIPLSISSNCIIFYDWDGNYHEIDMNGNPIKYIEHKTTEIDVSIIDTSKDFQKLLKEKLHFPNFYGMNWDAFWDCITGMVKLPDEIILKGWHIYKSKQKKDALIFEDIMKKYNQLSNCKYCNCIYLYYDVRKI